MYMTSDKMISIYMTSPFNPRVSLIKPKWMTERLPTTLGNLAGRIGRRLTNLNGGISWIIGSSSSKTGPKVGCGGTCKSSASSLLIGSEGEDEVIIRIITQPSSWSISFLFTAET